MFGTSDHKVLSYCILTKGPTELSTYLAVLEHMTLPVSVIKQMLHTKITTSFQETRNKCIVCQVINELQDFHIA